MGTILRVKEALKLIVMRSGKSIAKISEDLGFKQRASISQMINRESIRLDVAATVIKECGYKLVAIPDDVDVDDVGGIEIKGEIPNQSE